MNQEKINQELIIAEPVAPVHMPCALPFGDCREEQGTLGGLLPIGEHIPEG